MFPLSIEGNVDCVWSTPADAESIIQDVIAQLTREKVRNISRKGMRVSFSRFAFPLTANWQTLSVVDGGDIELIESDPIRLKYCFSVKHYFASTTLSSIVAAGIIATIGPIDPLVYFAPIGMWLWVFGFGYILISARLNAFMSGGGNSI